MLPTGFVTRARIVSLKNLSPSVLRLRLEAEDPFAYRAGQFINISRPDGLTRSYSLTSLQSDPYLEFHVRRVPFGAMTTWLQEAARFGESVHVCGPGGNCFYRSEDRFHPLLLAGTGPGVGPLFGILREALKLGHQGLITCLQGARTAAGFYYVEEFTRIAADHANVEYVSVSLQPEQILEQPNEIAGQGFDRYLRARFPRLFESQAYLCGNSTIVNSMRKTLFLLGARPDNIYAEAFYSSPRIVPAAAYCVLPGAENRPSIST